MNLTHEHPHDCTCHSCSAKHGVSGETHTALSVSLTINAAHQAEEWERRMEILFDRLFPYIELGGVAAGHLKGAVCAGNAKLFLSATIRNRIDRQHNSQWSSETVVSRPVVTVNLIAVFPVKLTNETLEELIRAELSHPV